MSARRAGSAAVVAVAAAVAAGCGSGGGNDAQRAVAPTGTPPPRAEVAEEAARAGGLDLDAPPRAGSVRLQDGPFTDRVRAVGLRLRRGKRPEVAGRLTNLTDVSDVLLLQVRADFYDRAGRWLGSGEQVFEEAEAFDEEALRFRVRAAEREPQAVAAVLSIPQLVNE